MGDSDSENSASENSGSENSAPENTVPEFENKSDNSNRWVHQL